MDHADRLPAWERAAFIEARERTCAYCGASGDRWTVNGDPWHIDHIVPRSSGGGGRAWADLALACPTCNGLKGEHSPAELPERLTLLAVELPEFADHVAAMLANSAAWLPGAAA